MTPVGVFRFLIVMEVGAAAFAFVPGGGPAEATQVMILPAIAYDAIAVTVLVLWIAAIIGLWRFRGWARPLYVAVACALLVLSFVPPYYVPGPAIDDFVSALEWIGTGALVALMYYSPVSGRFAGLSPAA